MLIKKIGKKKRKKEEDRYVSCTSPSLKNKKTATPPPSLVLYKRCQRCSRKK